MKYAQHPKRDCPTGRAGFEIDVLVIDSNPLPRSRISLPMCFHHRCKAKHSDGRCSSELGKRGQPDRAMQVTTNVSFRFGVVWVILDARVIRGYSHVDVWNVPEVLAREHFLGHVLTEFHYLFLNVMEKCVAGPAIKLYDHEYWAFSEIHCHGRTRSNQVCTNAFLVESKYGFFNCTHPVSQCVDHVV